jgi:hypothetical protein
MNPVPFPSVGDEPSDLVMSQINFGLAYAREARSAFDSGREEYGEMARGIAERAHATALRFASRFADPAQSYDTELAGLATELLALNLREQRSIA